MSADRKSRIHAVARVSSGNFLEMYDFMVFGYYAAAIGRAFFPSGNAYTSLMLSLRLPPTIDGEAAPHAMKSLLEADAPHAARVSFEPVQGAPGWNAPPTQPWLEQALERASRTHYGKPFAAMGEGGTIPFMAMLGKHFPDAQFLITGVLGPHSNAHGPNEFLHVPYATKLTACVAYVLAAHAAGR